MFADPQSLTIGADPAILLDRTGSSLNRGEYRSADGELSLAIQHTRNKRVRSVARLDKSSVVSDPLTEGSSLPTKYGVWVVTDYPTGTVTRNEVVDLIESLVTWLTPENILKLVNTET